MKTRNRNMLAVGLSAAMLTAGCGTEPAPTAAHHMVAGPAKPDKRAVSPDQPNPRPYPLPPVWHHAASVLLKDMRAEAHRPGAKLVIHTSSRTQAGHRYGNVTEILTVPVDHHGDRLRLQAESNDLHRPAVDDLNNFSAEAIVTPTGFIADSLIVQQLGGIGWSATYSWLKSQSEKPVPFYELVAPTTYCEGPEEKGTSEVPCHVPTGQEYHHDMTELAHVLPDMITAINKDRIPGVTEPIPSRDVLPPPVAP